MISAATFAPLPRPADILQALTLPAGDAETAPVWQRSGDRAVWFSRSCHSLASVASLQSRQRSRPASIWIPNYFCNQPLGPVRRQGHSLVFYPVTDRLEPDWAQCHGLLRAAPCDIFVLVHYFGVAAPAGEARHFADQAGAALLEDSAHVLRPATGIGESGDFVMYSPHKWLAAPNGAVLIVRPQNSGHQATLMAATPPIQPHAVSDLTWSGRRLLQRTPVGQFVRWLRPGGPPDFLGDPPESQVTDTCRITRMAHSLILRAPIPEIAGAYRENFRMLSAALPAGAPLKLFHVSQSTDAPYRLVIKADAEEFAARLYNALRHARLPVESWPDLPPEVSAAPEMHQVALALRRSVLMLPIHHTTNIGATAATLRRVLDTL